MSPTVTPHEAVRRLRELGEPSQELTFEQDGFVYVWGRWPGGMTTDYAEAWLDGEYWVPDGDIDSPVTEASVWRGPL